MHGMKPNEGKIPATLAILTKNNGKTLSRALESAKDFDDIIICDGGSTDDTLAIAAWYGARVIPQDKEFLDESGRIFDYAGVRNQTLGAARYDWYFFLDSDEYCGEDLVAAMKEVISKRTEGVFWVDRKYVINGVVIERAATYPNRQMRFFSKTSVNRFVKKVHERIELKEGVRPEILGGTMYIPFEPDLLAIRRKWDYQIAVEVAQKGDVSLLQYLEFVFEAAKVSALWGFRLIRNTLFSRGTKMPFRFEMERHRFHLKLLQALWSRVRIGGAHATRV